jgi:hypothetical protein
VSDPFRTANTFLDRIGLHDNRLADEYAAAFVRQSVLREAHAGLTELE